MWARSAERARPMLHHIANAPWAGPMCVGWQLRLCPLPGKHRLIQRTHLSFLDTAGGQLKPLPLKPDGFYHRDARPAAGGTGAARGRGRIFAYQCSK